MSLDPSAIPPSGGISICVVGATGAVGKCMIQCLADVHIPVKRLALYASKRSAGTTITTSWGDVEVQEFSLSTVIQEAFTVALLAVSGTFAQEVAPKLAEAGIVVVDNSSAFRYDNSVPLVIPEINPQAMRGTSMLIANPNCTTAIAAMVLWPLHKAFQIRRIIMSTYQAASGGGDAALEELETQLCDYGTRPLKTPTVFPHQLLGNVIPRIDSVQSNGYTKEEMKVVWETRKIFDQPDLLISCTAVRVATTRAHAESITIEFENTIDINKATDALKAAPMVVVEDDPQNDVYPTPLNCTSKFEVSVGRIRESIAFPQGKSIELFVCGDQLLRGAALNAVLIVKELGRQRGWF
ncbi:Aspartate-semialdehyde dehydrogenase, putative [Perkinsus marinus ATCC 50983]|uniref:aspartate-semialdehyde dehydrogenase n=1 Tax=Perkinsus marinus (strain ATCC 50983 / TXsc) TaxID=423536 RepID=C5LLB1_PERM5|nr:Aspartate-semialdehyde dehydrogenase, putative [Perkinsus marinus ATCC 50983]EER02470.1 Aspartate-semialdehyde dehydrogenase, putative [Perkinsus marinus ATCC 50983]|eukprot:XP_002769752.1 Aspartate-semialdehyde dehydrogenase, putative [Perkinsus marinus ATCC 50983]